MKAIQIRFLSPEDNSQPKEKRKTTKKSAPATGYISPVGKLVLPAKSVAQLGFDPENIQFKIGVQQGKRKIKSLYLVPTTEAHSETFSLEKAAKSYSISLPVILQKSKIDYTATKYTFTVKPFNYAEGVTAYELQLNDPTPKVPYTGKPRGRKPASKAVES